MTKEELDEKDSSSAACSSSSNSPSSMLSSCRSHSHRWSFFWKDNSKESCITGSPPLETPPASADSTFEPQLFSFSAVPACPNFPPCLVVGHGWMLRHGTFTAWTGRTFPNWCLAGLPPGSVWTDSGPVVFCLWWLPKTFVRATLVTARVSWGGELSPFNRFSLLSVAVLRWTGSRGALFAAPFWIYAGSELLREITLAWGGGGLESFTSVFWKIAFRLFVNLERPSPRFKKALLGRACAALAPSWLCSRNRTRFEFNVNWNLLVFPVK